MYYLTFLLTNCFAEYELRTLYGALVVTLAMLLRLISCRFIIFLLTFGEMESKAGCAFLKIPLKIPVANCRYTFCRFT